jgi:pimeloyl-ACP methyl ester carboxylesterase
MPFFYTNDCKLYYTVQGEGTPLVFIHPPVLTHINFKYQMNELSKHFKIITFDIRGHGRSDFSFQPLTYPLIVEDIVQLLDFLGLKKAFIGGYSTGGSIVLEFLINKSERSIGGIIISGLSEVNDWVTRNRILGGMGLAIVRAISTLAISIAWTNSNTKSLFWEMFGEARRGKAKNIEQYYRYALSFNCTQQLHKIDHPVLLLYGTKGSWLSPICQIIAR